MRLSCNYDEFMAKVSCVAPVADDSMSKNETKNVIFRLVNSDTPSVQLMGKNSHVLIRQSLSPEGYSVTFDEKDSDKVLFQVNCKELLSFLGAYKALRRTRVSEVIFEMTAKGAVKCTVVEEEIDDESGFDKKPIASYWIFKPIPILPKYLEELNRTVEDNVELVETPCVNMLWHTKNLFPIMQNGVNMYAYLTFTEKYVIAFNSVFTTVMNSKVESGVFNDCRLSYKVTGFLDKYLVGYQSFRACRLDNGKIYIKVDDGELFIEYDTKLSDYKNYIAMFRRDSGVAIDKVYFMDILKRLSLEKSTVEIKIDADDACLSFDNGKFSQQMSLLQMKGMEQYNGLRFKVMPETLSKAFIGDNENFSEVGFVYYCPYQGKPVIAFSDDEGEWFSVVRVATY